MYVVRIVKYEYTYIGQMAARLSTSNLSNSKPMKARAKLQAFIKRRTKVDMDLSVSSLKFGRLTLQVTGNNFYAIFIYYLLALLEKQYAWLIMRTCNKNFRNSPQTNRLL